MKKINWEYKDKTGNLGEAYTALQDYMKAKDISVKFNQQRKEVDFEVEMTRLENESEIIDLKRANELKNTYLIASILIGGLALLVLYLLWSNRKNTIENIEKTNLLNKKLQGQNKVLEKSLEALESSQQKNTRLLKIVAHDLRNPLTAIVNSCQLLADHSISDEDREELIEMIRSTSLSSMEFIRDLININTDGSDMKKEAVHFDKVILDCKKIIEHKAQEKQQIIKLDLQPITINANRERLWRVLSNLMTNAIKFSPHGSTISIHLTELEDHSTLLRIKDQGIGIPSEWKDRIFTMDKDVNRAGTNGEVSFGLGLLISKQIIEAHGGSIWFDSIPGVQTTFFVSFPAEMKVASNSLGA